jgi:Tol biopolymer transport system component
MDRGIAGRTLATTSLLGVLTAGLVLAGASPAGAAVGCSPPRQVTDVVDADLGFALSAAGGFHLTSDGEQAVFADSADLLGSNEDGGDEVYRYDRILNRLEQLTDLPDVAIRSLSMDVSGDGSRITFATDADPTGGNADGNRELFLLQPEGPEPRIRQLTATTGGTPSLHAAIDDAGDTIAFASDRNLASANPDLNHELFVAQLDADGDPTFSQSQATTGGDADNVRDIDISGDGNVVVYTSDQNRAGGNLDLNAEVMRTVVGGGTTQLTTTTGTLVNSEPALDRTGDRIAFHSEFPIVGTNADGNPELYVRDVSSAVTLRLTDSSDEVGDPQISGDGLVVVHSLAGGDGQVLRTLVDDPDPLTVSEAGANVAVDADGSRVVWAERPTGEDAEQIFLATCGEPSFTDVGLAHPFFPEIEWMAEEEISTGFQPGPTYAPSGPVSRQAMSAFMYRLAGSPAFADPSVPTFVDVPKTHPFSFEIEWMAATGISEGFQPGPTYRPAVAVSRAAMSAFMFRLAGATFADPATPTFSDVSAGHPFFTEVEWMASERITTGFQPGPTYRPSSPVSRQAMSAFMQRLGERVPFTPPPPS